MRETHAEYAYERGALADLAGNRYEKKRQLCNRFEREHAWRFRPFEADDFIPAMELYRRWLENRAGAHAEEFFVAQAEASFRADPASPMHDKAFDRSKTVVCYCASGGRSALVGKTLKDMGYDNVRNLGGFQGWVQAGGAVEKA